MGMPCLNVSASSVPPLLPPVKGADQRSRTVLPIRHKPRVQMPRKYRLTNPQFSFISYGQSKATPWLRNQLLQCKVLPVQQQSIENPWNLSDAKWPILIDRWRNKWEMFISSAWLTQSACNPLQQQQQHVQRSSAATTTQSSSRPFMSEKPVLQAAIQTKHS